VRNRGKNALVVIAAEGLCHIFDSDDLNSPGADGSVNPSVTLRESVLINCSCVLIADVDGDGRNELVLGSRNRILHVLEVQTRDLVATSSAGGTAGAGASGGVGVGSRQQISASPATATNSATQTIPPAVSSATTPDTCLLMKRDHLQLPSQVCSLSVTTLQFPNQEVFQPPTLVAQISASSSTSAPISNGGRPFVASLAILVGMERGAVIVDSAGTLHPIALSDPSEHGLAVDRTGSHSSGGSGNEKSSPSASPPPSGAEASPRLRSSRSGSLHRGSLGTPISPAVTVSDLRMQVKGRLNILPRTMRSSLATAFSPKIYAVASSSGLIHTRYDLCQHVSSAAGPLTAESACSSSFQVEGTILGLGALDLARYILLETFFFFFYFLILFLYQSR
jgi:hypothetical protein